MRKSKLSALVALIALVLAGSSTPARAQGTTPSPEERAAEWAAADLRVLTPGVVNSSGLPDLAAAYSKQTGKKVAIKLVGMGSVVETATKDNPPADVIMMPMELMSTLSIDGGIVPGTYTPLGRTQMGLAVRAGAPHPDISTVEKLAAALRSAKAVMRSNPATGNMVPKIIEDKVINRPEFAGVNSPPSSRGEGGQALVRGEGDMAIQTICQILPYKEIELVGPLPRELGAWIDMATAVSARAMHREQALAFIKYLLLPEADKVWKPRGLERFY